MRSVVFALGLLLVVSAAHAQSGAVSARVPFDFVVGKQVYAAGNYLLSPRGMSNESMLIHNTDEEKAGFVLTQSCEKSEPAEKTGLIFHRYGE